MSNALSKEISTYNRELSRLLGSDEGRFVLIIGDEVISTFDTYADAVKMGYAKAGVSPFLVKKVAQVDEVSNFSRALRPLVSAHAQH
jgi:hypothetical protein